MFTFDDLMRVDDRGIQALLKEVQSESLLVALKGATDDLREKIFRNMSSRAAEMLRGIWPRAARCGSAEVEAEQKEILQIARRLSDEGQLMLAEAAMASSSESFAERVQRQARTRLRADRPGRFRRRCRLPPRFIPREELGDVVRWSGRLDVPAATVPAAPASRHHGRAVSAAAEVLRCGQDAPGRAGPGASSGRGSVRRRARARSRRGAADRPRGGPERARDYRQQHEAEVGVPIAAALEQFSAS